MCVFKGPLDITQAEWIASLLLLLPPEAPVSIQSLMSHLLHMWNPFPETLTSSLSFSILSVLPSSHCPIRVPPLDCLESTFLAYCHCSVPLLSVIDDLLVPFSSTSWGHTQPNLCSVAPICSAGFSVCLLILWLALQPPKLPTSWMRDCSLIALSPPLPLSCPVFRNDRAAHASSSSIL